MKRVIEPGALRGTVRAIPSKSDAHRHLILAALAGSPTRLLMGALSEDIQATARCLAALGAVIEPHEGGLTVMPIARKGIVARGVGAYPVAPGHDEQPEGGRTGLGEGGSSQSVMPDSENPISPESATPDSENPIPPETLTLDCGESGSTLRFLLPLAAALGADARFITHGRLSERPNAPLIAALRSHGIGIDLDTPPFRISGALTPGVFELPGDVSSQYASGLLMALPLLHAPSEIVFTSPVQSKGYIELTLEVMGRYGVTVEPTERGYLVPAPQHIDSPGQVEMEGDWSNAAFFLAANAMGGEVRVEGLNPDSAQADRAVIPLIAQMTKTGSGPRTIDVSEIPDLLPILSVIATQTPGETRFVNAARLRMKESDRLAAMCEGLRALGADVCEHPDALTVRGGARLHGGQVSGYNDHRIVMAMTMAGTVADAPVVIDGAEAVNKSYPGFFEDFGKLGGRVHG